MYWDLRLRSGRSTVASGGGIIARLRTTESTSVRRVRQK